MSSEKWYPSVLKDCYGGGCGSQVIPEGGYNGRVAVLEPEDPQAPFKMFARVANKNKLSGCTYQDAMQGFFEPNDLSKQFFSNDNVKALQDGMSSGVSALSNNRYLVPPQNKDNLSIIMRSIFMSHATFSPTVPTETQVADLNQKVLNYAVPQLYSSAQSYEQYLKDQSTLVTPLTQPLNHDRNYKQLELPPFMYHDM